MTFNLLLIVFSIQITLLFLLDHLKLVVSQCERNKMTAQNIATCFGPVLFVLTGPSTTAVDFQRPIQVLKYLLEIWPAKSGKENPP